jgi:hypothetical protein
MDVLSGRKRLQPLTKPGKEASLNKTRQEW